MAATDDLERDVEAVIAACGGDLRAAIKTLLIANAFLEAEFERMSASVSAGFARRPVPQRH